MSEKKDSTSLWIAIIGFSLLILVVLSFFWVNYYSGNAHDYEGKNGKFNFHKLEVSGITFYQISAFFDGTEYLYGFRNHPSDLEDIYLENNVYNKLNKDKVIYVKIGQESKIYSQNGCIIIEGKGTEDLIRVSEKFAYHLLGVF